MRLSVITDAKAFFRAILRSKGHISSDGKAIIQGIFRSYLYNLLSVAFGISHNENKLCGTTCSYYKHCRPDSHTRNQPICDSAQNIVCPLRQARRFFHQYNILLK